MSKQPKENGSQRAASGNGKRRQNRRAPKAVTLRLCTCLEPNALHPLSALDPKIREAERQRLLASILARLANGPIQSPQLPGTIDQEPVPATIARVEPTSE